MDSKDIVLDNDNDLKFLNGDFLIEDSEEQEIKMILQAVKNDYKQFPELGVNLVNELSAGGSLLALKQKVKLNLRADNKDTKGLNIENGSISFK